jgi:plastocyanin
MRPKERSGLQRLAGLVAMLVVLGVVGFAGGAGNAAFAVGARTVTIGSTLSPKDITVAPGTTVTWKASGGKHRIESTAGPAELRSQDVTPGSTWSFTFTKVGTYSYLDHENKDNLALHGTVTVKTGAAAGGTPGAPAPPAPKTAAVTLANKAFSPSSVTIAVGGTVTWTNNDGAHNVTANGGAFKSPTFSSGTFKFTFTKAGTYPYNCTLHGGMNGTVTVVDATGAAPKAVAGAPAKPAAAGAVPAAVAAAPGRAGKHIVLVSDTGYSPATLNARAGDTVTWVNKGQAPHTVTGGGIDLAMDPGASVSTVLQKPGTIAYICTYHPYMKGSIVVGAAMPGVVIGAAGANTSGASGATAPAAAAPVSKGGKTKTVEIKVNEMTFGPAMAMANVGDTISWVNVGKIPHTVTAKDGSFDKTPLAPGQRFNYVLRKEGTIPYTCTYHPGMDGTLMVGPALAGVAVPAAGGQTKPDSPAPVSTGTAQTYVVEVKDSSFTPASLEAHVGDTISWVNLGKIPHTVTAKNHSFDKALKPGQRFNLVLDEEGVIQYVCTPHHEMFGVVMVGPALTVGEPAQAPPMTLASMSPVALAGVGTGWMLIIGLLALAQLRSRIAADGTRNPPRRRASTEDPS